MTDSLNDLTKRVADAIDQRFHDMGFEADPRNDPLWHKGVSIEIAKAAIAEVKKDEIPSGESDDCTHPDCPFCGDIARLQKSKSNR